MLIGLKVLSSVALQFYSYFWMQFRRLVISRFRHFVMPENDVPRVCNLKAVRIGGY
jgi:hypothetical protein